MTKTQQAAKARNDELWAAFRAIHGPRPGGRGAQDRWERQWEVFRAQAEHQGPVKIVDERGAYPSALDRAVEEQRAYYSRTN